MNNPFEVIDERFNTLENLIKGIAPKTAEKKTEDSGFMTEYATRHEAADMLRMSLETLSRLTKNGVLISYRIGGRVFYKRDEIKKAIIAVPSPK